MEQNQPVALFYPSRKPGLVVDWYIGKRCNFDCSYCSDVIHDLHSAHTPLVDMKRVVDIFTRQHAGNISWSLTGGEPTLHPQFPELCSYIRDQNPHITSITTNGFRSLEYLIDLFERLDCIVLSLHLESMGHRIEHFVEKIVRLEQWKNDWNAARDKSTSEKTFIIRLMVAPNQLEQVKYLFDVFKTHKIQRCELRMVKGPNYKTPKVPGIKAVRYEDLFSSEERLWILDLMKEEQQKKLHLFSQNSSGITTEELHYNDLQFNKRNSFKGWHCWAGLDHIKIDPAGEIFRGSCFVGGSVGNIYGDPNFELPNAPIVCDKAYCGDNIDLRSRKVKHMDKVLLQLVDLV